MDLRHSFFLLKKLYTQVILNKLTKILLEKYKVKKMKYEYIDKESLFIKNAINIIYGDKFSGKTYSTIKHLNLSDINPIHIDFDNNPNIEDLNYFSFGGSNDIFDDIVEGSGIIIIDHLDGFSNGKYMKEEDATKIVNKLKKLSIKNTIILLAHATVLRTASGKYVEYFRGNDKIVNNADTVYHLTQNNLEIEKHRGSNGETILNWMRE